MAEAGWPGYKVHPETLGFRNANRWPPKLCDRDSLVVEGLFAPLVHTHTHTNARIYLSPPKSLCVRTNERTSCVCLFGLKTALACSLARLALSRPKTINATTFLGHRRCRSQEKRKEVPHQTPPSLVSRSTGQEPDVCIRWYSLALILFDGHGTLLMQADRDYPTLKHTSSSSSSILLSACMYTLSLGHK